MDISLKASLQNLDIVFRRYRKKDDWLDDVISILANGDIAKFNKEIKSFPSRDLFKGCVPKALERLCSQEWSGIRTVWEMFFRCLEDLGFTDWPLEEREAVLSTIQVWMVHLDGINDLESFGIISETAYETGFDAELFGPEEEQGPSWKIVFWLGKHQLHLLLRNLVPMRLRESEVEINLDQIRVLKWHDIDSVGQLFDEIGTRATPESCGFG